MNAFSRLRTWALIAFVALLIALIPLSSGGQPTTSASAAPSASAPAIASAAPSSSESSEPSLARPPERPKKPSPVPRKEPNTDTTISVITFSPGDHPFYKFGHNAIWVHDPTRAPMQNSMAGEFNRDRVFNWGTFTFGDPALIPKFFQGRFMYWLSVQGIGLTKEAYWHEKRVVDVQELDLSPAQKTTMISLLEENLANPKYKYNYYEDNCSTRVRDMLDKTLAEPGEEHGPIWKQSQEKGRYTFREHTLRMTADLPAEAVILSLVMGNKIDQPLTKWQEEFLPGELQKNIENMTITWEDGSEHKLVKKSYRLQPPPPRAPIPDPVPPPETPPSWWWVGLLVGLLAGALNALVGWAGKRSFPARIAFGVLLSLQALIIGFLGVFFIGAWIGTDHEVGYHNENMLQCAPFAVVLVGGGIRIASRDRSHRIVASALFMFASTTGIIVGRYVTFWTGVIWFVFWASAFAGYLLREETIRKVVGAATALCLLGIVVKVLPWFNQQNWLFIFFFAPFWAGTLFGARALKLAIHDIPNLTRPLVAPVAPIAEEASKTKNKKKKAKPSSERAEEGDAKTETATETSAPATTDEDADPARDASTASEAKDTVDERRASDAPDAPNRGDEDAS